MNNKSIVENNDFLAFLGIYIPQKNSFPAGFVKYYPEDFIVEEIDEKGRMTSVEFIDIQNQAAPIGQSKFYEGVLVKRNMRTNEAIEEICTQLNCSIRQVQCSGLKDEDAVTAQRISFEGIPFEAIKSLKSDSFFIKDVEPSFKRLYNGVHKGNKFTVLLRGDIPDSKIIANTDELFLNYYYTQRFAFRYANHVWALFLLRGENEKALKHFFVHDSSQESEIVREIRRKASEKYGNWIEMRQVFDKDPKAFRDEIVILNSLIDDPQDIMGAFKKIENQVKLWFYALSSWLFNNKIADFVKENKELPKTLPLFLSNVPEDWEIYKNKVSELGIYPPLFSRIQNNFDSVAIKHNEVPCVEKARVNTVKYCPEGVIVSFNLGKGSYATSFLAHHFNLIHKGYLEDRFQKKVDIKA